MNILILALDVDLQRNRGDSIHVNELSAGLRELGHAVRLVTGTSPENVPIGLEHETRRSSTLGQILRGRSLAAKWADVIYERRGSPKVSWVISRLTGVPFVLEVNGVLDDEASRLSTSRESWSRWWIRRRMINDSAKVVAVSAGVQAQLRSAYNLDLEKIAVVPNGANTAIFQPENRDKSRSILGLKPDDKLVCFVGNLVWWQGVDLLLEAIAQLVPNDRQVKLLVVGDGPDLESLKAQSRALGIGDHVRFEGSVSNSRIPRYIISSDVCVAPFRRGRKASPIKIFEYLACGKPVVTSDIDEVGQFVRDIRGGLVVNPDSADELASAILQLFSDPAEAVAMGARGRAVVAISYSWQETARRVASILSLARQT